MDLLVYIYGIITFTFVIGLVGGMLLAWLLSMILSKIESHPDYDYRVECDDDTDTHRAIKEYYKRYEHIMSDDEKKAYLKMFGNYID